MGLLDDIRGLLTPKPAVVPNPFDRQANAAIPIMGASEILPNMVGRMTGSPMAEFAAGFLSPSSWMKSPKALGIIKNKKMHDAALDYFGKTTNPKETGYILDDGTRLDLSGRHYATGYEKTKTGQYRPIAGQPDYLANSRNVDHRELVDLGDKIGEDLDMYKFIDQTGAVRYMPDFGVSVLDTNMPSRAQVETFVRDFRRAGNPLSVDVDSFKTGGNVASQDFARPTVDEVYNFIQKYQKGDGPAMSTGRPRNHLGQEIPPTKYELAHAEAQRVAALPVEQGGLGLPPDNTAMDRARAMGVDTPAYRGVRNEVRTANEPGTYSTNLPDAANIYANSEPGANVMPVLIKNNAPYIAESYSDIGIFDAQKLRGLTDSGYDSAMYKQPNGANEYIEYISPVSGIRSRFAAFNPAKRDSADLLAGLAPWALPVGATLLGGSFLLPPEEY